MWGTRWGSMDKLEGVHTTGQKVGPQGKAAWCEWLGAEAIFWWWWKNLPWLVWKRHANICIDVRQEPPQLLASKGSLQRFCGSCGWVHWWQGPLLRVLNPKKLDLFFRRFFYWLPVVNHHGKPPFGDVFLIFPTTLSKSKYLFTMKFVFGKWFLCTFSVRIVANQIRENLRW